ncbi:polyprenyl synthetase family protein [Lentzea sp. NBRC 102530]|uniref:polyprenyl synthetase family protein n=1 Tax=Lentzea sp. NBRC 102530 TaxID=3032201 RepID=UPI0024A1DD1C|nr:polyprenyl synthetase family protein [Lentzea sp. NBRC 102530]GLY46867.1 (2E,6E)-farnesyl diphosphate synthase [Lentzea sp. NBRC 102530]
MTLARTPALDPRGIHAEVARAVQDTVIRLCPGVSAIAGYHAGWLTEEGAPAVGGLGKALRSRLAVLGGAAAGASTGMCVAAGVAVEFVHDFSLLQDDVMDGDTERRHRPAAWTVFGAPAALLTSDALLAAAAEVLLEADSPHAACATRVLLKTVRALVLGQTRDLAFEQRLDVTPEEYLAMAAGKTAALISCSASLGAVLAGAPTEVVMGLAEYGTNLGLAFQLTDDLLGIWGDAQLTGKPVLADLRRRKKSAPVVAALNSGGLHALELRDFYEDPGPLSETDVPRMALLVEQCHGRRWTIDRIALHTAEALRCLSGLRLPQDVAAELAEIAQSVPSRRK